MGRDFNSDEYHEELRLKAERQGAINIAVFGFNCWLDSCNILKMSMQEKIDKAIDLIKGEIK